MVTVQVSGVNTALLNEIEKYANEHDLNQAEASRELIRRGLQSLECAHS